MHGCAWWPNACKPILSIYKYFISVTYKNCVLCATQRFTCPKAYFVLLLLWTLLWQSLQMKYFNHIWISNYYIDTRPSWENKGFRKMVFKSGWLGLGVYFGFCPRREIQKSQLHLHAQLESLQVLSCLLSRVIALVILAAFVLCGRQLALPDSFKTWQGKTWSY